MALRIEAILSNSKDFEGTFAADFWVVASGVTPGSKVSGAVRGFTASGIPHLNIGSVTAPEGYSIGSAVSRALVPITYTYATENK